MDLISIKKEIKQNKKVLNYFWISLFFGLLAILLWINPFITPLKNILKS